MPVRGPLRTYRYVGLAGSAVLAAGAYQVGALPGLADADAVTNRADLTGVLACLGGLIALTVAWWRIGMIAAGPGEPARAGRWMLITAALWALPVLLAPPLASRDIYSYACQGALIQAGLDPHQVTSAATACPWLDSVPPIWRTAPSPYGPLAGLLSAGAAALSDGRVGVAVAVLRLLAVAGVLLAVWCGRGLAAACRVSGARAAWLGLASPLVIVHAFSGAHHDALMAGLVLAALALAASVRPGGRAGDWARVVAAGLVLGLAVAVKASALVALPFVAVLLSHAGRAGRHHGRDPVRASIVGPVVVTASAGLSFAILAIATGLGLGFRHGLAHTGDLAQWTSVPTAVGLSIGYAARALGVDSGQEVAINLTRLAGLVAAAGVVAMAWWVAYRAAAGPVGPAVLVGPTTRLPADPASAAGQVDRAGTIRRGVGGCGVAFAAVAVLGPVSYPWYALTPLALLAVATADDRVRAWLGVTGAALAFLILPNGVGLAARTKSAGAVLITATLVAATVIVLTARSRRRPARGVVPRCAGAQRRSRH